MQVVLALLFVYSLGSLVRLTVLRQGFKEIRAELDTCVLDAERVDAEIAAVLDSARRDPTFVSWCRGLPAASTGAEVFAAVQRDWPSHPILALDGKISAIHQRAYAAQERGQLLVKRIYRDPLPRCLSLLSDRMVDVSARDVLDAARTAKLLWDVYKWAREHLDG